MIFEFIPAEKLLEAWPKVREGLERILKKSPEPWIPENVFTELHEKRAFLYFGVEDGQRLGFFVVQPLKTPFSFEPVLNVWVLHADGEGGGNFSNVLRFRDEADTQFDRIGKAFGCVRVRFEGRKGWQKVMTNYEVTKTTYSRVIQ